MLKQQGFFCEEDAKIEVLVLSSWVAEDFGFREIASCELNSFGKTNQLLILLMRVYSGDGCEDVIRMHFLVWCD